MMLIVLEFHYGTIWGLDSVEWRRIFKALLGCKMILGLQPLAWSSESTVLSILMQQAGKEWVIIPSTGSSCRGRPISHKFTIVIGPTFFFASIHVLIHIVIKTKIYEFLHGCVISFLEAYAILTAVILIGLTSQQCGVLEIKGLSLNVWCLSRRQGNIFIIICGVSLDQILNIYVVHVSSTS